MCRLLVVASVGVWTTLRRHCCRHAEHAPETLARFIAAEPNDVMYSVSGCPGGVFISKMTAMSGLRGVEAGDYILEVDGRRLDRFGTATCDEISGENIRFDLLISLDERIVRDDASVALKICRPSEQGEPCGVFACWTALSKSSRCLCSMPPPMGHRDFAF